MAKSCPARFTANQSISLPSMCCQDETSGPVGAAAAVPDKVAVRMPDSAMRDRAVPRRRMVELQRGVSMAFDDSYLIYL
ncbi:hypothetical protein NN4_75310 [Nocardia ninae NBRC 108245]|uniref:Uncharacterized protein n=1 Tax=Nocardia ninae NBRC 108245 TaxID=1210091 RepID=A0A511MR00_9NOCA|nr:hypothetical protein NN4_75310 [Nocardia ninae NBRC 108245]